MRAILCKAYGPPESLVLEDVPDPRPGPGEVVVDVAAIGLNFTDLLAIEGRSQLRREFPFVPGIEISGHISALGEGETTLQLGQPVIGHRAVGGYAEKALFDFDEVYPIPANMGLADAAAFSIASMTSRYALIERGRLQRGETVLVLGAGSGAGLTAVQIGKIRGARVVAAASAPDKIQMALDQGADEGVLYPREVLDLAAQKAMGAKLIAASGPRGTKSTGSIGVLSSLSHGAGFDVIYDVVGGSYAEPALRALAWEGRYLSIGFSAGVPAPSLGPLLFKNATIHGIQPTGDDDRRLGRNVAAMDELVGWYAEGRLRPEVTAILPLERASDALNMLKDRTAKGRIVLAVDPNLQRDNS